MVISILILTVLGILIMFGQYTANWPPDVAQCPDYWTVTGNGKCTPNPALGNVGSGNCGLFDPSKLGPIEASSVGGYNSGGGRCNRHKKAVNCGFYWDGISDMTTCGLSPCTDPTYAKQNPTICGSSNSGGTCGHGQTQQCAPTPSPSSQVNLKFQL